MRKIVLLAVSVFGMFVITPFVSAEIGVDPRPDLEVSTEPRKPDSGPQPHYEDLKKPVNFTDKVRKFFGLKSEFESRDAKFKRQQAKADKESERIKKATLKEIEGPAGDKKGILGKIRDFFKSKETLAKEKALRKDWDAANREAVTKLTQDGEERPEKGDKKSREKRNKELVGDDFESLKKTLGGRKKNPTTEDLKDGVARQSRKILDKVEPLVRDGKVEAGLLRQHSDELLGNMSKLSDPLSKCDKLLASDKLSEESRNAVMDVRAKIIEAYQAKQPDRQLSLADHLDQAASSDIIAKLTKKRWDKAVAASPEKKVSSARAG